MRNPRQFVFFLLSCRLFGTDWRVPLFAALPDSLDYYHLRIGRQSILTDPRSGEVRTYGLGKLFSLVRDIRAKTQGGETPIFFVSTAGAMSSLVISLRLILQGVWIFDVYDDFSQYWGPRLDRLKGHFVSFAFYRLMSATIIAPPILKSKFPEAHKLEFASDILPVQNASRDLKSLLITSNLDGRIDYEFIEGVASKLPECEIHIYGRLNNRNRDLPRLEMLLKAVSNVKYCGEFAERGLQEIVARYGVALAPFRTNVPFTQATDPIRFYDYLNAGLEVISTDIPRARDRSNVIHIATDSSDASAIYKRILSNPQFRKANLWNHTENDWPYRANHFLEIVSMIAGADDVAQK
jgi:hypothetical protein